MRVELSYYSDTLEAEKQLYQVDFLRRANLDIRSVEQALKRMNEVSYMVSHTELLTRFQEVSKANQMYLEFPDVYAFIYAKGLKNGQYCGFFKDITKTNAFSRKHVMAANALPGPSSVIRCFLAPQGLEGSREQCFYKKSQAIS